MLLIALPMTLHVSVVIHYCSGQVASVRMFGHDGGMCCCGERAGEGFAFPCACLPEGGRACCSDRVVAMETDDYRMPACTVLSGPDATASPVVFLQPGAWLFDGRFAAGSYQTVFPPGGFGGYGKTLLTQICILRI